MPCWPHYCMRKAWTMTNLSSLSKGTASVGVAAAIAAGAAVWRFAAGGHGFAWDGAAVVAAVAVLGLAFWYLMTAARAVHHAAEVCEQSAHGNLEARILDLGEGGNLRTLHHGINNMLDIADAFIREAGASMDYVSHGKYFRKVLVRGLPGSFRNSACVINAATESMERKVRDFNGFAQSIAQSVGAGIES